MKDIPKLKSYPIIGSVGQLDFKDCLFKQLREKTNELGDAFRFKLFHKDILVVADLDSFREIIVKKRSTFLKGSTLNEIKHINKGRPSILDSDGKKWQQLRGELSPFFTPQTLEGLYEIAQRQLSQNLNLFGQEDKVDDVEALMGKIALSITSEFFIDHNFTITKEEITDSKAQCDTFYQFQKFLISELTKRMNYGPVWKYLPTINNLRFSKLIKEGKDFVREKIAQTSDKNTLITYLKNNGLESEDIVGHVYGLVGASFESTAISLSWALYFLAQRPNLQEELYDALKDADLKNTSSYINNETLEFFINETLRLRPAFPMLFREASEDETISQGQDMIEVKKGTIVFTLLGKILSNKKVWGENHDDFNPYRFKELTKEQKKSYIPYSSGTRTCLGREMANIEIKIILTHLVKSFKIVKACDLDKIKPKQKFVYSSDRPIQLEFVRR